jgi:hypothetical protein
MDGHPFPYQGLILDSHIVTTDNARFDKDMVTHVAIAT